MNVLVGTTWNPQAAEGEAEQTPPFRECKTEVEPVSGSNMENGDNRGCLFLPLLALPAVRVLWDFALFQ